MANYQTMFLSEKFCSYLKVYGETKQASRCKEVVSMTPVKSDVLINEVCNQKVIIPEMLVRRAMQPLYFYGHILELSGDYVPKVTTDFAPEITPELAKTEFFTKVLQCVLENTYKIGHIALPDGYKHPYSIYGRSKNDLCIIHKQNYTSAGVINLEDKISEDDEEEELDSHEIGYEEFKNPNTYATQQTIKEMMRASGDLTAKVLIEGKEVDVVIIYGLAASHTTKFAKLLQLKIDFNENTAVSFCSTDLVNMNIALNWLLNAIAI